MTAPPDFTRVWASVSLSKDSIVIFFLPPSVQVFDCFCSACSYVVPRWTAAVWPHRSSIELIFFGLPLATYTAV